MSDFMRDTFTETFSFSYEEVEQALIDYAAKEGLIYYDQGEYVVGVDIPIGLDDDDQITVDFEFGKVDLEG